MVNTPATDLRFVHNNHAGAGSYGIHRCLNIVRREIDHAAGVLLRALEPTSGVPLVWKATMNANSHRACSEAERGLTRSGSSAAASAGALPRYPDPAYFSETETFRSRKS